MSARELRITLPDGAGEVRSYEMLTRVAPVAGRAATWPRRVLAAPQVVPDVRVEYEPGRSIGIDWASTMAIRDHLWSFGIGIAEAMDTSERGRGFTWDQVQELIPVSAEKARQVGGELAAGVGTDQIDERDDVSIEGIVEAYLEQLEFVERHDTQAIIRPSRALLEVADSEGDYEHVYAKVLSHAKVPVIIHWLGAAFDPAMADYWTPGRPDGHPAFLADFAARHQQQLAGIKPSLLDEAAEVELRESLPASVRVLTGDDFNYPILIMGDERSNSDALIGVFSSLAPVVHAAFNALAVGDDSSCRELLEQTLPLARTMFEAPSSSYQAGLVFLAYLDGLQPHTRLLSGREGLRSPMHYVRLFKAADQAGSFTNPELAVERMRQFLVSAGLT